MAIIMIEHDNQGELRQYPFTDAASMTSTSGTRLPSDFIVDASLYPQNATGRVYLSHVDVGASRLVFSDDNGPLATAPLAGGDVATVRMLGKLPVAIGVVVYGAGRARLLGAAGDYHFTGDATELTPRACVAAPTTGVRGFILPDGTVITGDVKFIGENGVRVSTTLVRRTHTEQIIPVDPEEPITETVTHSYTPTLRVDVVGLPLRVPEDCEDDLPPPVKAIHVSAQSHGPVAINRATPTDLHINLRGVSLTDLCAAQKSYRRTGKVTPIPLPMWAGTVVTQVCRASAAVASMNNFGISAPSSGDYINPISVQAMEPVATMPPRVAIPPTATPEEIALAVERNMTATPAGGGVRINLHGFTRATRK